MIRRVLLLTSMAAAIGLAGCVDLAPKYHRPASPVPPALPQSSPYAPTEAGVAADLPWRDFFKDEKLKQVIALALANNRDLRVAILNIEEARAQYHVQRADLFPTVAASGNATYEQTAAGLSGSVSTSPTGVGGASGGTGVGSTGGATDGSGATATATGGGDRFFRIYSADLGVSSYELDLWGRVRNLTRQAFEQYLATSDARRATEISLISEVATDYVTYAADLQRLKTAQATLKTDQATLKLTQDRFNGGIASLLDVRQAETAVDQDRTDGAAFAAQGAQDVNALTLVVGAAVPADLLPTGQDATLPTLADVPAGLSSTVLLDRPDVREAEHQLRGYNANIGAARAAFFPSISLTASGGSTSLYLDKLFGPGTGTYSLSPNISLPLFDGGRNRANLRYAKAERDAAVATYEKAVQTAFRETADALAQRGTIAEQIAGQQDLVAAASAALRLSRARYESGIDTYLTTLTAQRALYTAQQTLISSRLTRASNLVTLYRVLGGGVR